MNFKNLAMWGIIVLLTIGLYNMFKNPQGTMAQKNNIIFSEFLTEVDNGRVVQVEISGKNIKRRRGIPNFGLFYIKPYRFSVISRKKYKISTCNL